VFFIRDNQHLLHCKEKLEQFGLPFSTKPSISCLTTKQLKDGNNDINYGVIYRKSIKPLSPSSDKHLISPDNIST